MWQAENAASTTSICLLLPPLLVGVLERAYKREGVGDAAPLLAPKNARAEARE